MNYSFEEKIYPVEENEHEFVEWAKEIQRKMKQEQEEEDELED